ncbi:MAG: hypothetical protein NT088_01150 [Candidatus Omnitrophica bacterium]|nr:hypothetical protein [Candidatus Omnitrophota bacterium]
MERNKLNTLKYFFILVSFIFGFPVLFFLSIVLLGLLSNISGFRFIIVNFKDIKLFPDIILLFLNSSIVISCWGISKHKKWGLFLFFLFFALNILSKILLLFLNCEHVCPFPVLGIILSFVIDIILVIFLVKILKIAKKDNLE